MLQTGDLFAARYRIERRLAQGGFATVFHAVHLGTERSVALKVLGAHVMNVADTLEKFQLEAKVSARVESEHIVEVFDAGFDEARQCAFLVMELLEGETLAERVQRSGRLEPDEAIELLRQAASGLDAAHGYTNSRGELTPIIHRDLKPENLFLQRRRDGTDVLKILDFGIAKVQGGAATQLTLAVRGTPPYMAPEQVDPAPVSPQTDVWALGLIAHVMLTGRHYWRSMSASDRNPQQVFAEILSTQREAPSVRLRASGQGAVLPAGFDAWFLRCIEKDPAQRFASAGAAVSALERTFEGLVVERNPNRSGTSRERAVARAALQQTEHYVAPPASKVTTAPPASKVPPAPKVQTGSLSNVTREMPGRPSRGSAAWHLALGAGAALVAVGAIAVWLLREAPDTRATSPEPALANATSRASLRPEREDPPPASGDLAPIDARGSAGSGDGSVLAAPRDDRAEGRATTGFGVRAVREADVPAPPIVAPTSAPGQGPKLAPAVGARDKASTAAGTQPGAGDRSVTRPRVDPVEARPASVGRASATGQQPPKASGIDPYNLDPHQMKPGAASPGERPSPAPSPPAASRPSPTPPAAIDPYDLTPDQLR